MRAWFQRLMVGRYGHDAFNSFLSMASLVCFLFGILLWDPFYYLGLGLLVYDYIRLFSRNIPKRRAENEWYLARRDEVLQFVRQERDRFAQRKVYRYYRCPRCRQELRVPRGRGRISIQCPKCGTQFVRKS